MKWGGGGGERRRRRRRKKKTGNVISIYSDLHLNTNHIIPQNMFQSIFMLYNTSVNIRGMLNNYSSNYVVLVCRESFVFPYTVIRTGWLSVFWCAVKVSCFHIQ
jgi:hypothetical protein